jgi:hypothetical protein
MVHFIYQNEWLIYPDKLHHFLKSADTAPEKKSAAACISRIELLYSAELFILQATGMAAIMPLN